MEKINALLNEAVTLENEAAVHGINGQYDLAKAKRTLSQSCMRDAITLQQRHDLSRLPRG